MEEPRESHEDAKRLPGPPLSAARSLLGMVLRPHKTPAATSAQAPVKMVGNAMVRTAVHDLTDRGTTTKGAVVSFRGGEGF